MQSLLVRKGGKMKRIEGEIMEVIGGRKYPCLDYTASWKDITRYAKKYNFNSVGVVAIGRDNRTWYRIVPSKLLAEIWISERGWPDMEDYYPLVPDEFEFKR